MTPLQAAIKKALPNNGSDGEESFFWKIKTLSKLERPERNVCLFKELGKNWLYDFVFPRSKIIVEIEGGVYIRGRHNRAKGFTTDCRKYNFATLHGWLLFRFTTEMVTNGEDLQTLDALQMPL